jgi:hypothetical protein
MMASRTDRAEEERSIVEIAEQQQRVLQQQYGPNEQMHGPVKADEKKKSGDENDATSTEAETPASAV